MNQSSTKDHQGLEIEKFIPHKSRMKKGMPSGTVRGGQSRVQLEGEAQELVHMPLLGSVGGVLWDSQAKARLVNSNQKKKGGVLVSSAVSYIMGVQGEGPGKALGGEGDCLSQGPLRKSYQELTFTCDYEGCYVGHALA